MLQIIRSHQRFHAQQDWLSTYWHFSFDHYYDPQNMSFGPLRVFNDDTIAPDNGFGMHPHREMEIVTYVTAGQLQHKDSMGHQSILTAGGLQRMSAGTGVYHSEVNPSPTEPLQLCQIWLLPQQRGLTPSYEERLFAPEARAGRLLPVVSGAGLPDTLTIHQDATFYIASLTPGQQVSHTLAPGRRGYLFIIAGAITCNGEQMAQGDQARITETAALTLAAQENTELILIDLP